jgi:hypothetical protein
MDSTPQRSAALALGMMLLATSGAQAQKGATPHAVAPRAESRAELQEWLAQRYPEGALVAVVTSNLGNTFDCVQRGRQPALRRADGTFRPIATPPAAPTSGLQPKLVPGEAPAVAESINCPTGSVPMAHVDLETLLRFPSLSAFFAKYPGAASPEAARIVGSTARHQYAKVDQYVDNWGGDAVFNLWNPYTERDSEFSLSQIWVVRGSGSDKQTLEAGWQDYPDLYGSDKPKLFIYSTQDGYGSTGCYNGTCGDFVQVSATITPTIGWTNHSSTGGTQYIIQLRWQRDDLNDNWWLMYGTQWVGYYPGTLYDSAGVKNEAARVSYGGEIIDDDAVDHTRTDMGSGGYPAGGWQQTAYTRTLRTISTSNTWQAASTASEFRTDANCYDVDLSSSAGVWANYFYFGGEGYGTSCE